MVPDESSTDFSQGADLGSFKVGCHAVFFS